MALSRQVPLGLSRVLVVKDSPANAGSIPGLGRSPGAGNGTLLLYYLPGKFHGQRSLAGYNTVHGTHKQPDMTEHRQTPLFCEGLFLHNPYP